MPHLISQELREIMSYDEMELDMIGDQEDSLVSDHVSDTDDHFQLCGCHHVQSQLFNLLCDKADDEHGGRLPVPCAMSLTG
ncbi:MAG: hypothetical protein ACLRMN_07540 [Mediterraneibacter gnavus]